MPSYNSQISNFGSLCYEKQQKINTILKSYNSSQAGLIRALRKKDKTLKKISACSLIKNKTKKYDKCYKRRFKSSKCKSIKNLYDKYFGKCIYGISMEKLKLIKNKINKMKGIILSTSVKKKGEKFKKIQCDLVVIKKIFEVNGGVNLTSVRNLYLKNISNDINKYYAEIFFDTIMNDNMFERNLGFMFFVVDDLKDKVVIPLLNVFEELINRIKQ